MSEIEEDIQALSEDLIAETRRMQEIEAEKARLQPDDPRMPELAAESEAIARRLVPKTVAERELVREAAMAAQTPEAGDG